MKALVFLYPFEEPTDCTLLSSFCDDSNFHISIFRLSTPHNNGKQGISRQMFNRKKIFIVPQLFGSPTH